MKYKLWWLFHWHCFTTWKRDNRDKCKLWWLLHWHCFTTWKRDNRDKMQASCGDCFTGNAVYVIRWKSSDLRFLGRPERRWGRERPMPLCEPAYCVQRHSELRRTDYVRYALHSTLYIHTHTLDQHSRQVRKTLLGYIYTRTALDIFSYLCWSLSTLGAGHTFL